MGGVSGGKVQKTVGLFNSTLAWTWVSPHLLGPGKAWAACSALDGQLYVLGGGDNLGPFQASAGAGVTARVQVFDPAGGAANGTWRYAANMTAPRWYHASAVLGGELYARPRPMNTRTKALCIPDSDCMLYNVMLDCSFLVAIPQLRFYR